MQIMVLNITIRRHGPDNSEPVLFISDDGLAVGHSIHSGMHLCSMPVLLTVWPDLVCLVYNV